MRTRITARAIALGVAAALALSACATNGSDPNSEESAGLPEGVYVSKWGTQAFKRNEPVVGGAMSIGNWAAVETLDPTASSFGNAVGVAVFDLLFRSDKDGGIVPDLAKSLSTDDDGKTWTIKLPTGVKFHDGTDFNADAVVFHWKRLAAEGSRSGAAGQLRQATRIEAPDAETVVVTLKSPSLTWPEIFVGISSSATSMIPSPASVARYGDQIGFHPVGVGPFMLESYVSGGDAVLVRNPDYRIKGLPYLDRLTIVQAVDEQSRRAAVQAGDLDAGSSESAVDLKKAEDAGLVTVTSPTYSYWMLLLNNARPPFDDLRFRQAVAHAIDYEAISESMYQGLQLPLSGTFPEAHPAYVETDWPKYDLDKAKKLIAEWQADTGLEPAFDLTIVSQPEVTQQSTIIQQMLADAGIKMEIRTSDVPTMITQGVRGEYQAQHRKGRINLTTDGTARQFYHSGGAFNHGKINDAEVDRYIDEASRTADIDERNELYGKLQERLAELVPQISITMQQEGWYLGKNVGGFPGTAPGLDRPDYRYLYIAK